MLAPGGHGEAEHVCVFFWPPATTLDQIPDPSATSSVVPEIVDLQHLPRGDPTYPAVKARFKGRTNVNANYLNKLTNL